MATIKFLATVENLHNLRPQLNAEKSISFAPLAVIKQFPSVIAVEAWAEVLYGDA